MRRGDFDPLEDWIVAKFARKLSISFVQLIQLHHTAAAILIDFDSANSFALVKLQIVQYVSHDHAGCWLWL